MAPRRLSPDEQALWRRVVEDVAPLRPAPVRIAPVTPARPPVSASPTPPVAVARPKPRGRVPAPLPPRPLPARPAAPANTLDASWDRRLRRGSVAPDMVIDLHGHTLGSAHATLDAALATAVASGDRILLVVAGRARQEGSRGAIRRSIGDWIAASRFAARIAAVRAAHPRHGGGGAFYLILRRPAD